MGQLTFANSDIKERFVKSCLDLVVLGLLKGSLQSGAYDLIAKIHTTFEVMVSPGVIYPILFSLERDGLIKPSWKERKKTYEIAPKGEQALKSLEEAYRVVQKRVLQQFDF